MPRDLLADRNTLDAMPQLSREPPAARPPASQQSQSRFQKTPAIQPLSSLLSLADLDECDWLEHAAFDPIEAASREKVSPWRSPPPMPSPPTLPIPSPLVAPLHDWASVRQQP